MDISWSNIDNLDDYFITYLLYNESKTVSQISKIRNIPIADVNDHLINFWNWEKMHDLNL